MIKKCPYCFEDFTSTEKPVKCPECQQYLIDNLVEAEYHGVQKKKCFFCGKLIFAEAIFCKYCHRWLDEINRAVDDLKGMED